LLDSLLQEKDMCLCLEYDVIIFVRSTNYQYYSTDDGKYRRQF